MSTAKPAKSRCTVRTRPRSSAETAMAIASAPQTSVVWVRMLLTSYPSPARSRPGEAAAGQRSIPVCSADPTPGADLDVRIAPPGAGIRILVFAQEGRRVGRRDRIDGEGHGGSLQREAGTRVARVAIGALGVHRRMLDGPACRRQRLRRRPRRRARRPTRPTQPPSTPAASVHAATIATQRASLAFILRPPRRPSASTAAPEAAPNPYCLTSCESRGRFIPRRVAARVMFPPVSASARAMQSRSMSRLRSLRLTPRRMTA